MEFSVAIDCRNDAVRMRCYDNLCHCGNEQNCRIAM